MHVIYIIYFLNINIINNVYKTIDKFNYLFIPSSFTVGYICVTVMYAIVCMHAYVCIICWVFAAVGTLYGLLLCYVYIYCDLYIVDVNVCSVLFLYVFFCCSLFFVLFCLLLICCYSPLMYGVNEYTVQDECMFFLLQAPQ